MPVDIGAATIILMGTAAAPHNLANGGSNANLTTVTDDAVTHGLTGLNFSTSQGTVDVTKLNNPSLTRRFIAELISNTASGSYIDDTNGILFRRFSAIRAGIIHPRGRGKVDFRVLVGGAVSGNLQVDFTGILTGVPFNVDIASALGGSFEVQVDGALTATTQP